MTDEQMRTSIDGVFAADDARTKRYRRITTALSDGTVAALAATDYVLDRARSEPPTAHAKPKDLATQTAAHASL